MILEKFETLSRRIADAARRSGRDPSSVGLVAVVKKSSSEDVRTLLLSGRVPWFAESRLQDAARRRMELGPAAEKGRWRFIGHLQTNKAASAAELFESIDSVDSLRLARTLDAAAARMQKRLEILIQVKLTDRETQSGLRPEEAGGFLKELQAFPNLSPNGLMAIAPLCEETPEQARPGFRRMRELLEKHFPPDRFPQRRLSMGMSNDFEVAVEEGSTLLRIGSALFSQDREDGAGLRTESKGENQA
ncbi:MAG: YggS family pyridoxal phosphate-dependent enzyme [Elusimicrobiota bacterium]|jgi:hypothetical protein